MSRLVVYEHKSTSHDIAPGSRFWMRCILDTQISNYVEGARVLGLGEPAGVVYDVLRKLSLKPIFATPESEREYTQEKSRACPDCKRKGGELTAPHAWYRDECGEWLPANYTTERVYCNGGRFVTEAPRLVARQHERDESVEEFRARCFAEIAAHPERYYQRSFVVRTDDDERDAAFDTWQIGQQIRESGKANRWPRNPDACEAYGRLCEYFPVCSGVTSIDDDALYQDAETHEELAQKKKHALPLLTTSSAKAYRACQRKYLHGYVQRRRGREKTQALVDGTILHVGLEHWWSTVDIDRAVDMMGHSAKRAGLEWWQFVRLEVLLRGYHARWENEPIDVLHVEKDFEAPLINPETGGVSRTWLRAGKFDVIARERNE